MLLGMECSEDVTTKDLAANIKHTMGVVWLASGITFKFFPIGSTLKGWKKGGK